MGLFIECPSVPHPPGWETWGAGTMLCLSLGVHVEHEVNNQGREEGRAVYIWGTGHQDQQATINIRRTNAQDVLHLRVLGSVPGSPLHSRRSRHCLPQAHPHTSGTGPSSDIRPRLLHSNPSALIGQQGKLRSGMGYRPVSDCTAVLEQSWIQTLSPASQMDAA